MAFSFNYLARSSSSGNIDAGKAWIYNGSAATGSNETLATIVAPGYFNAAQVILTDYFPAGYTGTQGALAVGDVLDIRGNDANGMYYVTSITTNVTLAVWNETSGVTYSGSPAVIGDLPAFGDTSGDIVDSGIAADTVLTNAADGQMGSGFSLFLDKGTGTEASNAVTVSNQAGVITTSSLTTAAGDSYVITLTNTEIASTSVVLVSEMGGSNTTPGVELIATAGSGSSTITINNNNASAALNGTLLIGFVVL